MKAWKPLPALVIALSLASPGFAQDFESGAEALRRGDFTTAREIWQPLAEQGHARAQYRLGRLYEYGRGLPQSDGAAISWYRRAAAQGLAAAQYRLAILHDNGWGLSEDDGEAARLYGAAAQQGHAYAQFDLGLMYAAGTGVPRDLARAYMWIELAAAQGNGHMLKHRNEIAKIMTPTEIAKAQEMARDWAPRPRD